MTKAMTGAKMVVQALIDQGVDTVFGYPGGAIMPVYDELYKFSDQLNHIIDQILSSSSIYSI